MAARFWVGGTDTWNATAGSKWATSSGGAGGAAVPTSSDTVTFDNGAGGSGTVTVDSPNGAGIVTVQSITMGAFVGTLDFATNDNDVTLSSAFSGTGTAVRTLNMGDGTWLVQGFNNNTWDYSTVTNLTHNSNGSTLSFIPSTATPNGTIAFISGGRSFNIVTHSGVTNSIVFAISGAPTIATLNLTASANVTFASGTTTTITNAPAWHGTSSNQFFIGSTNTSAVATIALSAAGGTAQWAALRGLTVTTNALTATNSFDLRSNTLITITPPSGGGAGGGSVFGAQGGVIA